MNKTSISRTFLVGIICSSTFYAGAQGVAINSSGADPNSSSGLDISFTNKGLLIPRMTQAQRDAISSPAPSLLIYQTDGTSGYYYYVNSAWTLAISGSQPWIKAGSNIYQTTLSDNVGIGTSSPSSILHLKGNSDVTQLIVQGNSTQSNTSPLIKLQNSAGTDFMSIHSDNATNIFIGINAGRVNDVSSGALNNVYIGKDAGYSNTTGVWNTAIGASALISNTTASGNTACGTRALYYNTLGYNNSAYGSEALYSNTTAGRNTAIGLSALYTQSYSNGGVLWYSNNVAVGYRALYSNQPTSVTNGYQNTAVGFSAGTTNTTGNSNTYLGYNADGSATLTNATAIGANASVTSSNSLVLGSGVNVGIGSSAPSEKLVVAGGIKVDDSDANSGTLANILKFGSGSSGEGIGSKRTATGNQWGLDFYTNSVNQMALTNGGNVGIGTSSPSAKLHVKGNADVTQLIVQGNSTQSNTSPLIKLQNSSGTDFMSIHSDNATNIFIGINAGKVNDISSGALNNVFIGKDAGYSNTTGVWNTSIGASALISNTTASGNTACGTRALYYNTLGYNNSAFGSEALYSNTTAGRNTAIGLSALYTQSYSNGGVLWYSNNVAVGYRALYSNQPTSATNGYQNTAVGISAGTTNTTGSSNTYLGYNADGSATLTNATAIGANASVTASNSLVLGSSVNVGIGTTAPDEKLAVSASIKADNDDANSGTTSNTLKFGSGATGECIGSKRTSGGNQWGLDFYSNGANRLSITNGGNVGIGTTSPSSFFSVGASSQFQLNSSGTIISGTWNGTSIGVGYGGTGTSTAFTSGSVVFAGSSGVYSQDNSNLFWDNSNNRLCIGTTTSLESITVSGDAAFNSRIKFKTANADGGSFAVIGLDAGSTKDFEIYDYPNARPMFKVIGSSRDAYLYGNVGIGTTSPSDVLTVAGNAVPSADNSYTCGKSGQRWSAVWAANGTIQTSDIRKKENINELTYGLDEVMKLNPVFYSWKERPGQGKKIGFIAQDVQKIMSELVIEGDDENKTLGINYADFVPVLVHAIQEQQNQIAQKNDELRSLKVELNDLKGDFLKMKNNPEVSSLNY